MLCFCYVITCYVMIMLRYITCYLMLCYTTCNVCYITCYFMLCYITCYVTSYNMLCSVYFMLYLLYNM